MTYKYDENGNRESTELDLGGSVAYEIKTDYTYDNMNRLTDIIQKKMSDVNIASYKYLSKANGNRHSLAEYLNSENRNITYGYDELNRLVSETAAEDSNGYSVTYEYDLVGNRLSREVTTNNQGLRTEYEYYEGTDRLYKEIHTGFAARLDSGNESYYAYADSTGGFYYRDSSGKVVGAVRAFFADLPSKLSGWLFGIVSAFLVIAFFVPNLLMRKSRHRLSFFHRGMCILIACIMFISPEGINLLSDAAVQYSQIGTSSWGAAGKETTYEYDDNGSVTKKTTLPISEQYPYEKVYYTYDLANRLIQVKTDVSDNPTKYVEYTYNDDGIRVKAHSYDSTAGGNHKTVVYLIDSYNHTGYAQSLEELTYQGSSSTPRSGRKYVIGDDVISQQSWVLSTISSPRYLLYDGHGSTRQLAYYTGTDVAIADSYSYDGYGVLLQDEATVSANPGKVSTQATSLLYAGEHFDTDSQQYYNRARWYNPLSGLFNQMDSCSGATKEPQSLHKYLYCHGNPVNRYDPSGYFSISELSCVQFVMKTVRSPSVQAAWKVYSIADVTLEVVGIITQFAMTGTINPWIAGSLIADIGPFDEIFSAVRKLRNLGKGVRTVGKVASDVPDAAKIVDGLTDAYRNMDKSKEAVEAIGELGAMSIAKGHGLEAVNFIHLPGNRGFDFIYKNAQTGAYVIVEAKGGTGRLARNLSTFDNAAQMSQKWIAGNIEKLELLNPKLASELWKQAADGTLEAMVVSTRLDDARDAVQSIKYAYVGWNEIGETAFGLSGF